MLSSRLTYRLTETMPRTLIVKLGAIGDVLMLLPAVYRLHLAGSEIDWVCGPGVLPILQLYPWINPIVADDKAILLGTRAAKLKALLKVWSRLGRGRYDLAATLYYDRRYRLLALPVRARRKLLLSRAERSRRILPGRQHSAEFARILLDLPDEVRSESVPPLGPVSLPASPLPVRVRPRIVLAPAGARNLLAEAVLRRWPVEFYVALATELVARGHEVVLIGSAEDAWVEPSFRQLGVTSVIGKLGLQEVLSLLDAADLCVTHDTGPLHLAGATRCSIVGLFGPTDPHTFLPRRAGVVGVWGGEGFACRPCYDGHAFARCPANDCMRQISVAQVLAEVLAGLDARASGTLPPARIITPATTIPCGTVSGPKLVAIR